MSTLLQDAANYVDWDTNEETRCQMSKLIEAKDLAALEKALSTRLQFGTAGKNALIFQDISNSMMLKRLNNVIYYDYVDDGRSTRSNGSWL